MKRREFAQVGFIQPILNGLESSGVALSPILKKAGVDAFNLDHGENYLPFPLFDSLVEQIEVQQGIRNLAGEFRQSFEASCCGEWGAMLAASPSMMSVCRKAEAMSDVIFTNERIRVRIEGKLAHYEQWFTDPAGAERTQLIHMNATLMLNTFKLFLGDDWEPREVHFQSRAAMDLDSFFPNPNRIKVHAGMPSTGLVLEAHLLKRGFGGSSRMPSRPKFDFPVPRSPADQVEALLSSTKPGRVPTIQEAANYLDTSERSLRRALALESTSYSELVDQWRRGVAIEKLSDPRYRPEEISELLGYSNAPSFFRAFKRWTKHSPNAFRELEQP